MKTITNFRRDARGMYLDLADQSCAIALNRKTGDILLDEGHGPDRYHGAAIFLDSKPCFTLDFSGPWLGVELCFGKATSKHFLGMTRKRNAAVKWVTEANLLLGQPTRLFHRPLVFRGRTSRLRSISAMPVQIDLQDTAGTAIEIDGGLSGHPLLLGYQRKTSLKRLGNVTVHFGKASMVGEATPPNQKVVIEQGGRVLHRRRGRKFGVLVTKLRLGNATPAGATAGSSSSDERRSTFEPISVCPAN